MTALHLAAAVGDSTIARHLILNGANLKVKDRNGYEPVHMAVWNRHLAVVNTFASHDISVIQSAVCREEYAEYPEILDSWNHCHKQMQNPVTINFVTTYILTPPIPSGYHGNVTEPLVFTHF